MKPSLARLRFVKRSRTPSKVGVALKGIGKGWRIENLKKLMQKVRRK